MKAYLFPRSQICTSIITLSVLAFSLSKAPAQNVAVPPDVVTAAFGDREGAFVLIDCESGVASNHEMKASMEKFAPCSTFKIWNTLIGIECGIISSADEPFYQWDGTKRFIPEWNKDLTLKEAFQASCVPAYQELARKIGPERMQKWLDRIGYGNRDISSGIDVFWLHEPDRKALLISPLEQAALMRQLVKGLLPFSDKSTAILKDIMLATKTDKGTLYGKTGTAGDGTNTGRYIRGWYVGYVETSSGKTFSFACFAKGKDEKTLTMGKDARAIVETILQKQGML